MNTIVMRFLRNHWPHVVVWVLLFIYLLFAQDLFVLVFVKNGRPIQSDNSIPAESDQILFMIEGLDSYSKDGARFHNLYGWALMRLKDDESPDRFVREIVLISDEKNYFFSVKSVDRNPELPDEFIGAEEDLDRLGFSALIAEDAIKPGEYRVGIVFRDLATGSAFYWDKPASYLVKTPNTLTWKRK